METETMLYQSEDALVQLNVLVENETVWLTQAQMVSLFQRDVSVISRHIRNIFKEGELCSDSNLHFLQIANSDKPVDDSRLYTFGASFKDLGKKLFCFSLMENPKVVAAVRKLIE